MSKKQWVCHISGQGEKWEVDISRTYEDDTDYCVRAKLQNTRSKLHWLPKSEYRLCDPPEVWRDVTEECKVSPLAGSELSHGGMKVYLPMGYRFRKEFHDGRGWCLIMEQKVSQ